MDWTNLQGKTFHTINGAVFTVTKVTRKNVLIRPEGGRRDYDLSISAELEHGLNALAAGEFFPSPTELVRIGVRHERNSYVWGILKAVWQKQQTIAIPIVRTQDFAGNWQIRELTDMDTSYLEESDEEAHITIKKTLHGNWSGTYHFGVSGGEMNGSAREFGGESLLLFGFDGYDEMEAVSGGGWARVNAHGELEGEFVGQYGEFTAVRQPPAHKRMIKPR